MTAFKFNPILDTNYLFDLYGEDIEYAKEMFEIFFESTAIEFPDIENYLSEGNTSDAKSLVHKLKPSFHMVGLRQIGDEMQLIENLLEEEKLDEARPIFDAIRSKVSQSLDLLNEELQRMKSHLDQ